MIFTELAVRGVYLIEPTPTADDRGFFARTWCARVWSEHGLRSRIAQCSVSFNSRRGTLRGMHYQVGPFEEAKLVRCTAGVIYDVALDLRSDSVTARKWCSVELSAENRRMLYIPEGVAHGFQTLVDDTEVFYQISEVYDPQSARGVRWNDPAFGIVWPSVTPILSARDANYPDFP